MSPGMCCYSPANVARPFYYILTKSQKGGAKEMKKFHIYITDISQLINHTNEGMKM